MPLARRTKEKQMTKKKTVEFEEGWADELIDDGTMTQEEVDALERIIKEFVEDGTVLEEDKNTRH